MRVVAVALGEDLLSRLRDAGAVLTGPRARGVDMVLVRVDAAAGLPRIATLKTALAPAGALWVIRPRGHPEITERAVMQAGQAAGLVDVKIARVDDSDTAMKFVYRLRDR
jgi:hypothetical protein